MYHGRDGLRRLADMAKPWEIAGFCMSRSPMFSQRKERDFHRNGIGVHARFIEEVGPAHGIWALPAEDGSPMVSALNRTARRNRWVPTPAESESGG